MVRRLLERALGISFVGCVLLGVSSALIADEIRPVDADWSPGGMRQVNVVGATASSEMGSPDGGYAASRVIDGNRGTKWVASIAPTEAAPQSITLTLSGPQKVSGVAVFGEEVGNDGIKDGRILVAGEDGEFKPVATIRDAKSRRWLAVFEPVEAGAVKLEVTSSPGSSPHTDVYEIVVVGPKLSPVEFKRYAKRRLADCAKRRADTEEAVLALNIKGDPQFSGLDNVLDADKATWEGLSQRFGGWDSLDEAAREEVVAGIDRLDARLKRRLDGLAVAAKVWPKRAKELAAVQAAAKKLGDKVETSKANAAVRLANRHVVADVNIKDGTWDVTWVDVDAAVRGIGFKLDVEGKKLEADSTRIQISPVDDRFGPGMEIRQTWGDAVQVERRIRVMEGKPGVIVSATITNKSDKDVQIGWPTLVDVSADGWWHLGGVMRAPASRCRPTPDEEATAGETTDYSSGDVLAMVSPQSGESLVVGALCGLKGGPVVRAQFKNGAGGTSLHAGFGFTRTLAPGETLEQGPVWISAEKDGFVGLERYGDAVAATSELPVRTGATALWCSWYPIRMTISEEITLAHAEIVAKHFAPLGLKILQLDHGWQKGEICGDWFPKEAFPHGFKWLSEQLESKYGLKLGLWIAPTQVAHTSDLFKEHPEWMLQGSDGKPAVTGQWYWVPNPKMSILNAGHPEAEKWLEETFARLSSQGSCYYKIDFIAGSPSLRTAMAAIRRGAGRDAWIRYCQTPPLMSVGLASSAYQGMDTGDSGLANWLDLERNNAASLASNYWVNGRIYNREICDMSVGNAAEIEEARFKMTMMALSGCSISFSDDFRDLDLPRIRLMQKCLPPGNPMARPLDLFESDLPSTWHIHCKGAAGEWDAVGIVNLGKEPQERTIEFDAFGLPSDAEATVFEFWEEKSLGTRQGSVTVTVPPASARILLIHRKPTRPDVIATDMHVLGGYHEIKQLDWDESNATLSGVCERMPGLEGDLYVFVPPGYKPASDSGLASVDGRLWRKRVVFDDAEVKFTIPFERTK